MTFTSFLLCKSDIWKSVGNNKKAAASNEVRKVGQLMTATELRSTKKYWHVMRHDKSKAVYPEIYDKNVVGILWSTMIQFGTWFGGAPYLPYGIQLLPLTPISEERDDIAWANEMYYPFSKACAANFDCTESGWVSLQLAILATVGYPDEAAKRVGALPDDSFENAGGNGHSKSNTIWYIATRPVVEDPVPIDESDARGSDEKKPAPVFVLKDCYTPKTCTDEVLDRKAGEYSCRERISWVINAMGKSQWQACFTVSAVDYPNVCGPCDPSLTAEKDQSSIVDEYNDSNEIENDSMQQCPPCTEEECNSDLNYCPVFDRTFVCTQGASKGGCSGQAWTNKAQCDGCCELTSCQKKRDQESAKITNDIKASERAKCPPCSPAVCYGELNLCPIHTAPFLCTQGSSVGGCATKPWHVSEESPCSECCEVTITC